MVTPATETAEPVVSVEPGNGKVTLSWEAIPGASRYAVLSYKNGSYTTYTSTLTSTSYTVSGLTNGVSYTFVVQSNVNGVWSSLDNRFTGTPSSSLPAGPEPVVSVVAGNGKVTLSWNAVPGASRYAVLGYKNGSYTTYTSTLTSTSYIVSGLTNGVSYTFVVQSNVNGVWSSLENRVTAMPISPTSSEPVVSTAAGNGKVTLSWDAIPGTSRYAVLGYKNGSYTIYTSTLTTTSYTVSGLTNGVSCTFVVQSNVNGVWSSLDNRVTATPVFPTSPEPMVSVVPGNGKVTLNWDAIPGASRYAVLGYKNGSYTTYTSTLTSTSYTVSGLTSGASYMFVIQSNVNGVWSSLDNCFTGTPSSSVPAGPEPVVSVVPGNRKVTLSWDAIPGASRYAVLGYKNGSYTTYTSTLSTTSYTVSGLTNSVSYTFVVQSNVNGVWSSLENRVIAMPSP
jgi:hypothetical protein